MHLQGLQTLWGTLSLKSVQWILRKTKLPPSVLMDNLHVLFVWPSVPVLWHNAVLSDTGFSLNLAADGYRNTHRAVDYSQLSWAEPSSIVFRCIGLTAQSKSRASWTEGSHKAAAPLGRNLSCCWDPRAQLCVYYLTVFCLYLMHRRAGCWKALHHVPCGKL